MKSIFPNLNAEQARYGDSNDSVAKFLGISRTSYHNKKTNGKFSLSEAVRLCEKYKVSVSYLFSNEPIPPINM